MILYGFMVRYGENNRWGPPPPVVFRQNERPWLLGLTRFCSSAARGFHSSTFWEFVIFSYKVKRLGTAGTWATLFFCFVV